MNSGIRIIKRDHADSLQESTPGQRNTTKQQSEREIANAVKIWIAELAQRKRVAEQSAFIFRNRAHPVTCFSGGPQG